MRLSGEVTGNVTFQGEPCVTETGLKCDTCQMHPTAQAGEREGRVSRLRLCRVKAKELQNEVEPRFFRLRESSAFPKAFCFGE